MEIKKLDQTQAYQKAMSKKNWDVSFKNYISLSQNTVSTKSTLGFFLIFKAFLYFFKI